MVSGMPVEPGGATAANSAGNRAVIVVPIFCAIAIAVTRVRVLEALRGATRIACELETGRQHQIRIHLAEAGHPLVGEPVYIRDYRGPLIPAPRPLLHAGALGFLHPRDGRPLRFEEPRPADFAEGLRRLRR